MSGHEYQITVFSPQGKLVQVGKRLFVYSPYLF